MNSWSDKICPVPRVRLYPNHERIDLLQERTGIKNVGGAFEPWLTRFMRVSAMTIYSRESSISIHVPEDIMSRLQASWGNLPRRALKALAVEAYRDKVLSAAEVGLLLGHKSRWETEVFLCEKQSYLHYTEEDLTRDMEAIRNVTGQ